MAWTDLKDAIASVIKLNENQEITGDILQSVLLSMVEQIGENATFVDIAIPSTIPDSFDGPVFYLATEQGVYPNFNGYSHDGSRLVIFRNISGSWIATETDIAVGDFGNTFVPLADRDVSGIAGGDVIDFDSEQYLFGVNGDGHFMAGKTGELDRVAFIELTPDTIGGVAHWDNTNGYLKISDYVQLNENGIGYGKAPNRPVDMIWDYTAYKTHVAIGDSNNYVNVLMNMYGSSSALIGPGLQANVYSGNYPAYSINAIKKGSASLTSPILFFDTRMNDGMPSGQLVTRFAKNYYGSADTNYLVDIFEDGRLETLGGLKNRGVFVDGFGGQGWCVTSAGTATFENLTVRGSMTVYSLSVKKIDFRGGTDVISDGGNVLFVADEGSANTKYIYFDNKNGAFGSPFAVNDIVRTQNFNGQNVKYWEGTVSAFVNDVTYQGQHCSRITVYSANFATTSPTVGDAVVRMGNTSDPNRQSFILLTSAESNSPYIRFVTGRNAVGSTGSIMCQLGNLASINDPDFGGVINDSGLYAQSVYLKGKFIITGGNAATQGYADGVASTAQSNAIAEAGNLANQAEADAIAEAGNLADQAEADAISTASADATTKANNAQTTAISTAAADATTKANNAQSTAISTAATDATNKANQAESNANSYSDSIVNTLSASLGNLAYEDLVESSKLGTSILIGGYFKTDLINATWIQSSVINTTYIEGLALNFTQGKIGNFQIMTNSIGHQIDGNKFVTLANQTDSNVIVSTYDSYGRLGLNIYRYNTAIGTDGLKFARFGQITDKDTTDTWGSTPQYGIQIQFRKDSVNKDIFRVDNTGALIAGANFTYDKIWTDNWALFADGSAEFLVAKLGSMTLTTEVLRYGQDIPDSEEFMLRPSLGYLEFKSKDSTRQVWVGKKEFDTDIYSMGSFSSTKTSSTASNIAIELIAKNAFRNWAIWGEGDIVTNGQSICYKYKTWSINYDDGTNGGLQFCSQIVIMAYSSYNGAVSLPTATSIRDIYHIDASVPFMMRMLIISHYNSERSFRVYGRTTAYSGLDTDAHFTMKDNGGATYEYREFGDGDAFEFLLVSYSNSSNVAYTAGKSQ